MSILSQAWHWFWFAQTGLHLALFGWLMRRRFYGDYPIFFLYTGFASLHTSALLAMNYMPSVSGDQYYAFYLGSSGVLTVLRFAVVYELLRHVLQNYPALRNLGTRAFCWATIILVAAAIFLAWFAPASGSGHVMSVVFVLARTADLLLCGLLLLLFLFRRLFNLSWRSCTFGIALGLGVLASADLATYAIRAQVEPLTRNLNTDVLDLMTQFATFCSVLVWMIYIASPERQHQAVVRLPEHDLETWNQELQRLLQQ
jgi:hypothetical protein